MKMNSRQKVKPTTAVTIIVLKIMMMTIIMIKYEYYKI